MQNWILARCAARGGRPGMGNLPSRLPLELFRLGYAERSGQPPNSLLRGGEVIAPDPASSSAAARPRQLRGWQKQTGAPAEEADSQSAAAASVAVQLACR